MKPQRYRFRIKKTAEPRASAEPMESIIDAARSLPTDLKTFLAGFGSSETAHRYQTNRVNAMIETRRGLIEARWFLQRGTDEQLHSVGIHPRARQMMVRAGWTAVMNEDA